MVRSILIDGKRYTLDVAVSDGERVDFRFGGDESSHTAMEQASVREVRPGVYSILIAGQSHLVTVVNEGERTLAQVNGIEVEVEVEDPRRGSTGGGARSHAGKLTIKSPMPGKVVRLLVREGEEVVAGQGIVVVEAMKMQNELKTTQAGKVASLPAKEGDAVSSGVVLAVIE